MPDRALSDLSRELDAEKRQLVKAEKDIEAGWTRLRNQLDLVTVLRCGQQDTAAAVKLVDLLRRTLLEWDRHRALIEQRIAHLEARRSRLSVK